MDACRRTHALCRPQVPALRRVDQREHRCECTVDYIAVCLSHLSPRPSTSAAASTASFASAAEAQSVLCLASSSARRTGAESTTWNCA